MKEWRDAQDSVELEIGWVIPVSLFLDASVARRGARSFCPCFLCWALALRRNYALLRLPRTRLIASQL